MLNKQTDGSLPSGVSLSEHERPCRGRRPGLSDLLKWSRPISPSVPAPRATGCASPLSWTCKDTKNKMKMKVIIVNGPNLNLLGVREPGIYGSESMEAYLTKLRRRYPDVEINHYQSNVEGELINKLQEAGFSYDGIILNAGAYTHTSIALLDCIRSLRTPVIEVHISNVDGREEYRRHSMIAPGCKGTIQGFGLDSYRLAVEALLGDGERGAG